MSTPRRTKELRMPIGVDAGGKTESIAIGYVVETDFGGGQIKRDFELNIGVLNPVLYQQVKPFAGKSTYITIPGVEFAKRYKAPNGAATTENDPDVGHE